VDEEFHELGAIPYRIRMDAEYGAAAMQEARGRGLHVRTVAYKGFPIDTGSLVALKLLDPEGKIPASIFSCNMYADRTETLVLGKAAAKAAERQGKRVVAVAVSNLTHRLHPAPVPLDRDFVSSRQDDEWNRKLLELLGEGRLEDVSQLARTVAAQARPDSRLKAIWWLSAFAGSNNGYEGNVLAYAPIQGAGCAVVSLRPAPGKGADLEFDEGEVETYAGDRGVLSGGGPSPKPDVSRTSTGSTSAVPARLESLPVQMPSSQAPKPAPASTPIHAADAPKPVGAYPHARRVGELLFLSGVGPREPGTDRIPGGPIRDGAGNTLDYDVAAQTRAVIENVRRILVASGSSLEKVLDVTVFLVDMDRDFAAYNSVYNEVFGPIGATRTTIAIRALPTPIAVEFKVLAAV
jgi:2-aminomuconate deaminase